ncbi:hypothetical protein AVEN_113385-1 [Araneus ventricosus]|uniref:Uncharacterized protein n=1 Tax=Araneus ventricosus TaxID=182803 RepID=A0A4Y2IAB3_ARAVE|nr:hypothetical protein AVEN_113385-1 [Araneus ventricosus]
MMIKKCILSEETPTIVRFHVTVLSIDSIDEGSMTYVADIFIFLSVDVRGRHLHVAELEGRPTTAAGEHDVEVPSAPDQLAEEDVATRLLLQECQESHLPGDDHSQPLHMAIQRQDHSVHGQIDPRAVLRHEVRSLPPRHTDMFLENGEL